MPDRPRRRHPGGVTISRDATTARHLTDVPRYQGSLPSLDHEVTEWPGRLVESGGMRLYVREVQGPGPDCEVAVFVHGLGGSSTNWTDLAGLLSGRMRGLI